MKEVEPLRNVRHLILTDKLVHCRGADPHDLGGFSCSQNSLLHSEPPYNKKYYFNMMWTALSSG